MDRHLPLSIQRARQKRLGSRDPRRRRPRGSSGFPANLASKRSRHAVRRTHISAATSQRINPPNAKPRRMVTELPAGRRRLFVEGDEYHILVESTVRSRPSTDDLPVEQFRPLLHWYENWSRQILVISHVEPPSRSRSALLKPLAGTWTFGDSDRLCQSSCVQGLGEQMTQTHVFWDTNLRRI